MANIELRFLDSDPAEGYKPEMQCFVNTKNEITVRIVDSVHPEDFQVISLDIPTAIKFAKTIRTEINKAKEVDNG